MPEPGPAITVVGSVHMDLVAIADRLPQRGESLTGHSFHLHPGGKGGNQAAQVALCGVQAFLISRLGSDAFGRELLARLEAKGVNTSFVGIDDEAMTGASPLLVGSDGEYASIIVPGAAARLTASDVDAAQAAFAASQATMLQFEIPLTVSTHAAALARRRGHTVILNASPAPLDPLGIPHVLWENVDLLIVNGVEAERLAARPVSDVSSARQAALALRARFGIATVIVTLGASGAVAVTSTGTLHASSWPVEVADTIGAGDAFAGTFAAELVSGRALPQALMAATAAGALAVTRPGAFDALPTRAEIRALIASRSQEEAVTAVTADA